MNDATEQQAGPIFWIIITGLLAGMFLLLAYQFLLK
jgi:hypothetical protein